MSIYTNADTTVNFLSDEEQRTLIAAAQDVPVTIETGDDGAEVVRFGRTREADAALTRLVQAFSPLIKSVARTSKVLDYDEAEATCYERFLQAVREFDPAVIRSFSAAVRAMLRMEISDKDRTSDLIQVKENVAARYFRLIHKHDGDVAAAYEECRLTANGFDPASFLAIHRAIGIESIDRAADSRDFRDFSRQETSLTDQTVNFDEALAQADLVRWAFTKVTEREATVLRLRYGFDDLATENIRSAAGFLNDKSDMVMSDREVAQCLRSSTATVNRIRREALAVMRAAMDDLARDGE